MKKSLLYLFTVLCTLSIFSSCKDDEDTSWKNISADYETEKLALTLNGVALSDQKVKVEAIDPENAVITLTEPIDGIALVTIQARLIKVNDEYTFEANSGQVSLQTKMPQTDGYSIAATGKISSKGILTMDVKIGEVFAQEGIFLGDLKINDGSLNETIRQKVYINKVEDRLLQLKINNFQFMNMQLGNLQVDNIVTFVKAGKTIFTGKGTLELPIGICNLDITGSIENNKLTLNIAVNLAALKVNVVFEGSKIEKDMSSEAEILQFSFTSELVTSQPKIEGKNIYFFVKEGITQEELKGLIPTIKVSDKATITPESGIAQDFSSEVTYTVVSEDGVTTNKYVVSCARSRMFVFSEWKNGVNGQKPEFTYQEPTNGFATSNVGAHLIKAIYSSDFFPVEQIEYMTNLPYCGARVEDGDRNKFSAKIQTLDTRGFPSMMPGVPVIPRITSGSLFLGTFEIDMLNTLNSTKFGVRFNSEPTKFKGTYKYKAGSDYYVCTGTDYANEANLVVLDNSKKDECSIVAVLYEVKSDSEVLTGLDLFTSPERVAMAQLKDGTDKAEFTDFDINFEYFEGKTYDPSKKYKLAIVCSSSKDGDKFSGAPGSTLIVDNLEIIMK